MEHEENLTSNRKDEEQNRSEDEFTVKVLFIDSAVLPRIGLLSESVPSPVVQYRTKGSQLDKPANPTPFYEFNVRYQDRGEVYQPTGIVYQMYDRHGREVATKFLYVSENYSKLVDRDTVEDELRRNVNKQHESEKRLLLEYQEQERLRQEEEYYSFFSKNIGPDYEYLDREERSGHSLSILSVASSDNPDISRRESVVQFKQEIENTIRVNIDRTIARGKAAATFGIYLLPGVGELDDIATLLNDKSPPNERSWAVVSLAIGFIPGSDLFKGGRKAEKVLDASKTLKKLDAVDEITDLGKRIDPPVIRYKPQHWDDAEKALDNVVHDAYTKRPGREKLDNLLNQGKNAPRLTAPNSVPNHIKILGDDVSHWLGKDAKAVTNEAGDTIIQSADGLREIRFDFNHTYPHKNPHTHLIEYKMVKNKKVEITNRRIYPSGVTPE